MPRVTGNGCGVKVTSTGSPAARESVCAISGVCWWSSTLYARTLSCSSTCEYASRLFRPAPELPESALTTQFCAETSLRCSRGARGREPAGEVHDLHPGAEQLGREGERDVSRGGEKDRRALPRGAACLVEAYIGESGHRALHAHEVSDAGPDLALAREERDLERRMHRAQARELNPRVARGAKNSNAEGMHLNACLNILYADASGAHSARVSLRVAWIKKV